MNDHLMNDHLSTHYIGRLYDHVTNPPPLTPAQVQAAAERFDAEKAARLTVGQLRAMLAETPQDAFVCTVMGDMGTGFAKGIQTGRAKFDGPACHAGGDAERCGEDDGDPVVFIDPYNDGHNYV